MFIASVFIKIENFETIRPHHQATHILVLKDEDKINVIFVADDEYSTGTFELSRDNAKKLVKELMDELYGEVH